MAETTLSVDRPVDRGSNKRAVAGSRSTARSTETNREQHHFSRPAAWSTEGLRSTARLTGKHAHGYAEKLPEDQSTGSVDRSDLT